MERWWRGPVLRRGHLGHAPAVAHAPATAATSKVIVEMNADLATKYDL